MSPVRVPHVRGKKCERNSASHSVNTCLEVFTFAYEIVPWGSRSRNEKPKGFLKAFPCFHEECVTMAINISYWGRNQVERGEVSKWLFLGAFFSGCCFWVFRKKIPWVTDEAAVNRGSDRCTESLRACPRRGPSTDCVSITYTAVNRWIHLIKFCGVPTSGFCLAFWICYYNITNACISDTFTHATAISFFFFWGMSDCQNNTKKWPFTIECSYSIMLLFIVVSWWFISLGKL